MASNKKRKSSSSSSSDSAGYSIRASPPKLASQWTRHNLESIAVFYDDKASSVKNILSILKDQTPKRIKCFEKMPELGFNLIKLTTKVLTFSINPENILRLDELEPILDEVTSKFGVIVDEFEQLNRDGLLKEFTSLMVFRRWIGHAADFLFYLRIFLRRSCMVKASSDVCAREGCYNELFMNFMKMCLLKAELGEAFKGEIIVMGKIVSGIPDVRFPCLTKQCEPIGVVTAAEIKYGVRMKRNEDFRIKQLNEAVLGQHGIQLLIERKNSFFETAIVGIICIGTKLIFTFLDVDEEQFRSIRNKKYLDMDSSVKIKYTRPFNFLDLSDRNEILELCFWLGYLQSNSFYNT